MIEKCIFDFRLSKGGGSECSFEHGVCFPYVGRQFRLYVVIFTISWSLFYSIFQNTPQYISPNHISTRTVPVHNTSLHVTTLRLRLPPKISYKTAAYYRIIQQRIPAFFIASKRISFVPVTFVRTIIIVINNNTVRTVVKHARNSVVVRLKTTGFTS